MDTRASKLDKLKQLVDDYSWDARLDNLDQQLSAFDRILDQQIAPSRDPSVPGTGCVTAPTSSIKQPPPSQGPYSCMPLSHGTSLPGGKSVSYTLPMLPPATESTNHAECASTAPPAPLGLPPGRDTAATASAWSCATSQPEVADAQDVASQAPLEEKPVERPSQMFTPGDPSMEAPLFPLPDLRSRRPRTPPLAASLTPLRPVTPSRREWTLQSPPKAAGGPGVVATPVAFMACTTTPFAPPPHCTAHAPPPQVCAPPVSVPPAHTIQPPSRPQTHSHAYTTAPQACVAGAYPQTVQCAPPVHFVPPKRVDAWSATPILQSRSPRVQQYAYHVSQPYACSDAPGHLTEVVTGLSCPPRGGTCPVSPVHGSENCPPSAPTLGRHLSHPILPVSHEDTNNAASNSQHDRDITKEPGHPIEKLGPYCPSRGRKLKVAQKGAPGVPVLGSREALMHHRERSRSVPDAPSWKDDVEEILRPPARAAGAQHVDDMADTLFHVPRLNDAFSRVRVRTPSASPGLAASPVSLQSATPMVSPRCCYTVNGRVLPPARGYVRDTDASMKMPRLSSPARLPGTYATHGGVGTTPESIGVHVYDIGAHAVADASMERVEQKKLHTGPQPQKPIMSHSEEYAVKGRPWHVLPPKRMLHEMTLDACAERSQLAVPVNLGTPFRPVLHLER